MTGKTYMLTDEEITRLVQMCAKAGAESYQKQERERLESRERDKGRRIKEKLASYRRVKKVIEEEREYTPQEKYEYRLKFLEDLMGDPFEFGGTERILIAQEEKRRQDQYAISQIDAALNLYRRECDDSAGDDESCRRYRELRMLYIDSPALTAEQIAELENVSVKTVYRDINIACEIMYQYIVGM